MLQLASKPVAQMMAGHGLFNDYRSRLGMADEPTCPLCGAERDDAEHALFACAEWRPGANDRPGDKGAGGLVEAVETGAEREFRRILPRAPQEEEVGDVRTSLTFLFPCICFSFPFSFSLLFFFMHLPPFFRLPFSESIPFRHHLDIY